MAFCTFCSKNQTRKKHKLFITMAILLFISLLECTKNPFDSDEIDYRITRISGKAILSDQRSPENIFIWLEGFDLDTSPDKNGYFQFQLPEPTLQPYGGLTGAFKIYFFLANYELDSAKVYVKNGLLLTSRGDLDKNGRLRQQKILTEKLRISIHVSPDTVVDDSASTLNIELRLEATQDTVFIHYPDRAQGPLSLLFFRNASNKNGSVKIFENSPFASTAPMIADSISIFPKFWVSAARFKSIGLQKGSYEVIPFFIIDHNKVPEDLLDNIGNLIDRPTFDFLKVPTLRSGNKLTVISSGSR